MAPDTATVRWELLDHVMSLEQRNCTDLRLMAIALIRAVNPHLDDSIMEVFKLIIYRRPWKAELLALVKSHLLYCYRQYIAVAGLPRPLPLDPRATEWDLDII